MRRRLGATVAILALALALLAAVPVTATPVTNNFTGGNNGNDWNTAANWSLGHVPLAGEDVTVATANPILNTGSNAVANSITISSGRTLSISASKSLTVGTGTSSLAGTVTLSSGSLTLNGDTTWSAGASTISMDTASTITINSTFEMTANDSTNTDAGSVMHVSGTGSLTTSNTGTANIGVELDNDGAVSVGSGTLELGVGDSGTTAGSYSIASGATLLLGSGSLQSSSSLTPMSIAGAGTMAVGAGTLTVGSADTFTPHTVDLRGNPGKLTLNKDASIPTFTTTGAGNTVTRNGTGTLTVTGSAGFAASTSFTGGTTTIAGTVPSLALGGAPVTVDSSGGGTPTLALDTPTTWSGGTDTLDLFGGNATLNIGASFDITGDGQIGGAFNPVIHVSNTGSITTSNPGTATLEAVVDNDGTVSVGSGTLELSGGDNGSTAGGYSIASGATLLLQNGSLEAPSITGAGTMAVVAGTLRAGSGDTFTPHTVDLRGDGGKLTVDEDVSVPTFDTSGAGNRVTRDGTGTLTVTGAAAWAANTTFAGGTTTIAGTVPSLSLGGAPVTVDSSVGSATLTLDTPTTWSGGADTISLFGGSTPATLNIGSSFAITGDGQIGSAFGTLVHVLGGGSLTTSNPGTATIQGPLDNDGGVSVGSGTLSLPVGLTQAGGSTDVSAGAELDGPVTLDGGTLKGNGALGGPVDNVSGTVAPGASPGTLTVTGDYAQGPGGTLSVDVDGRTPGTQFDVLAVGGAATLDGTVAVVQGGGFVPVDGDTFSFLTFGSRSGQFAGLTGGAIAGGGSYAIDYVTGAARLVVGIPAPSDQVAPSIGGTPAVGQALTCDPGTWSGGPSFTFQWLRDGAPIAGATGQQYTPTSGDAGHALTCTVTGTNAKGSASATSAPVTVPAPAPTSGGSGTPPPPPPPPAPTPEAKLAAETPAQVATTLGLPSARRCVSRRVFAIHLRAPAGVVLRSVAIKVDGRTVKVRRSGARFTATVDLRGLPKGRFTVTIRLTTSSGRRITGKRAYHTCAPKRG